MSSINDPNLNTLDAMKFQLEKQKTLSRLLFFNGSHENNNVALVIDFESPGNCDLLSNQRACGQNFFELPVQTLN